MKNKFLLAAVFVIVIAASSLACFDAYLFLEKRPLTYAAQQFSIDSIGEYAMTEMQDPTQDAFLFKSTAYYGFSDTFTGKFGIVSDEKPRGEFKFDVMELGLMKAFKLNQILSLTPILDAASDFNFKSLSAESSLSMLWYLGSVTVNIHPGLAYEDSQSEGSAFSGGGHAGVFYSFANKALAGIGTEYFNTEWASSIFLGAHLGDRFYMQTEILKGLANSKDAMLAFTIKYFTNAHIH